MTEESTRSDWLGDAPDQAPPSNWGTWGDEDELGALNYLTSSEVLRGVEAVEKGETFSLGLPIDHEDGDPVWPGRHDADHHMVADYGHYETGKRSTPDNSRSSDDVIYMFTHGTTHFDALGHVWYGTELYNGFDARTTMGGLERCGIEHTASHGVIGRGVLLDVARYRGVGRLGPQSRITLDELRECADEQGLSLEKRDIINVRTGATELWYEEGPQAYFDEYFDEDEAGESAVRFPGITYSQDLLEWFDDMEIAAYCTDNIGFEQTVSDVTGTVHPLHRPFIRDLGIAGNELSKYDELAADCAEDGKYDFLYVAMPLKISGATAGPTNPVAIK